jgi:hypothetical protein
MVLNHLYVEGRTVQYRTPLRSPFTSEADGRRSGSTTPSTAKGPRREGSSGSCIWHRRDHSTSQHAPLCSAWPWYSRRSHTAGFLRRVSRSASQRSTGRGYPFLCKAKTSIRPLFTSRSPPSSHSFPQNKTSRGIDRSLVAGCTTGSFCPWCPYTRRRSKPLRSRSLPLDPM